MRRAPVAVRPNGGHQPAPDGDRERQNTERRRATADAIAANNKVGGANAVLPPKAP